MATKQRNMGSFDRAFRALVIAPAAIVAAIVLGASSIGGMLLIVLACIALATSAVGFCLAYVPFGIDTRGRTALPH